MHFKVSTILFIYLIPSISCRFKADSPAIVSGKNIRDSISEIKFKKASFKKDEPFQIIRAARSITTESSATDTDDCKGWEIPANVIPKIIKDSRSIDGIEWDILFSVLPCIVKGQLDQRGNIFEFELNGGSWMYIKSADTILIMGNFNKADEKYFIVKPGKE